MNVSRKIGRRGFLKHAGAWAGVAAAARPAQVRTQEPALHVALLCPPADPVTSAPPSQWAADFLQETAAARGIRVRRCSSFDEVRPDELTIVATGGDTPLARELLAAARAGVPGGPESFVIAPSRRAARPVLIAAAKDARGLVYALTELVDRIDHAVDPREALRLDKAVAGAALCSVRGAMRLFVSDVEDRGWFHDRSFWRQYLTMLVTHRFNRINLAFGIGYDFARQLRDTYLYFAYPFLVSVPGFDVRASGLDPAERDKNLESLRFISEEAARRGLHFQLGLWTHAFEWIQSPNANYTILGLTSETHAAYCREAIRTLLGACPEVSGVTIRSHGESGVPEGDAGRDDFWRAVFGGIGAVGRPIEIDLHAKGIDQKIIDMALATGQRVRVSPKFWAEHMGLPYLQASIRALELPKAEPGRDSLMALSTGTRNHMRYSYGDLLMKGRRYGILHRVWPGTQRLLLWGDPAYAAQLGRAFSDFGADGVEFMEPLSFKGRKGSGLPGGRGAYADATLHPPGGDWRKYAYTYRLWGRLAFDPDSDPAGWRRQLRHEHGPAAGAVESALATSSRILPLISSAHCPSAANNNYWPELYTNMSIVDPSRPGSYSDTPAPKVFGQVSSLDPQLFASADDYAESLLAGQPIGKITPTDVARQLDRWADASAADLARADADVENHDDPAYRRVATDSSIAAATGRFFARKLRASVLFAVFDRSASTRAREQALDQYRQARAIWADLASRAADVYVRDITFGYDAQLRGHWLDRLPAIDRDIAAMEARTAQRVSKEVAAERVAAAIDAVLQPRAAPALPIEHVPPASFRRGGAIAILARAPRDLVSLRLWYRRLNQAETYRSQEMRREALTWRAEIPGDYTEPPYPVQYYFEARSAAGVSLSPGFKSDFLGRPYFVTEPA